MRRASRVVAAVLAASLVGAAARGGEPDEAARRQLAELKALCDAGLVAPPVCLEKQRAILGLPARDAAADVPRAADAAASGTVHESALGFRLVLPPGWAALAPEQVAAGFETLRSRADGEAARLVERLHAENAGDAELFVSGRDTLMAKAAGPPPADAPARAKLCGRQEAAASKAAARPVRTFACGSRTVAGASAFHLERDGLLPDTRMLQYWIPGSDGRGVQLVMSCPAADADARRREMEAIVESFRWR